MNFTKIFILLGSILFISILLISIDSKLKLTGAFSSSLGDLNKSTDNTLTPSQISTKLDQSLDSLEERNQELELLKEGIDSYKKELETVLDSYTSLGANLMNSVQGAKQISDKIEKTKQESLKMEEEISSIKEAVRIDHLGDNLTYNKNYGSNPLVIFFGILTLINSTIFLIALIYIKRNYKNFI